MHMQLASNPNLRRNRKSCGAATGEGREGDCRRPRAIAGDQDLLASDKSSSWPPTQNVKSSFLNNPFSDKHSVFTQNQSLSNASL